MKARAHMLASIVLALFGCASCSTGNDRLHITGEAVLLSKPYPLNYPSSAPKQNQIIGVLRDEEVVVLDEKVEKDFMVYRVRTADGREGYVLAGQNISRTQQNP